MQIYRNKKWQLLQVLFRLTRDLFELFVQQWDDISTDTEHRAGLSVQRSLYYGAIREIAALVKIVSTADDDAVVTKESQEMASVGTVGLQLLPNSESKQVGLLGVNVDVEDKLKVS